MKKNILALLLFALLLSGCGPDRQEKPAAHAPSATEPRPNRVIDMAMEAAALSQPPPSPIILPTLASGERVKTCPDGEIDYSHTEDGYVMMRYTSDTKMRLKALIQGPTTVYSYDLPVDTWTALPLSDGSGSYRFGIYIQVEGSKYATVLTQDWEATLSDEFAPFLRPNRYVDYWEATEAVTLGLTLTAGIDDTLEKVAAVYDYVVEEFSYDYEKAATVKSGYIPNLDRVLEAKKGICFDYAAVMTAMLRSQGIPCKLVVGYAGETYHAWISVWTAENGWVDGVIFFDGQSWKRMDPTFASSGSRSEEIMDFIEHGSYTVRYLY